MFQFDRRHFIKSGIATAAVTAVPFVAEGASRSESGTTFIAGFGKADITPDRPVPTIYTKQNAPLISMIIDPIHARTTYMNKGDEKVVIVSVICSLFPPGLPMRSKMTWRNWAFRRTGLRSIARIPTRHRKSFFFEPLNRPMMHITISSKIG